MENNDTIYVAISGVVIAMDAETGREIWRQPLRKGAGVTTLYPRGKRLLASTSGELWALDAASGQVLWHNAMKGLGLGFVSIAGAPSQAAANASSGADEAAMLAMTATSSSGDDCGSSGADCGSD